MNASAELPAPSLLDGFALSPQQRLAWRRRGAASEDAPCIAATLSDVGGPEDIRQRLLSLIEDQEILRTRYAATAELREPVQVPEPFATGFLRYSVEDWRGLDVDDVERGKQRVWQQFLRTPVEVGLSVHVAELAEGAAHLVLVAPALSADVRSLARVLRVAEGSLTVGAGDAVQYADLAAWFQDVVSAEESEAGRHFWRARPPASVAAGSNGLEDGGGTSEPGETLWRERGLSRELSDGLRAVAGRMDLDIDDLHFGVWLRLLRLLSADERLPTVARVFDGVSAPELADSWGLLERSLPFSLAPAGDIATLADFRAVADICSQMRDYQDCHPCEFDAAAYVFRYLDASCSHGRVERWRAPAGEYRVLASVAAQNGEDRLNVEAAEGVLSESAADWMLIQWQGLLESVVANGDETEPLYPEFAADARTRLLGLCRGPFKPIGQTQQVVAWVEQTLARGGQGALIDGRRHALAELNARANRLARQLLVTGAVRGQVIGLHLPRSADYVVAMLATLKIGAAYLPMDIDYPLERLSYMVDSVHPFAVLTRQPNHRLFDEGHSVNTLDLEGAERAAMAYSDENLSIEIHGEDLAYVLYTSGSTGKPKGVMIPHRALFNHMRWMMERFGFGGDDVFLQRTSASFDASVWEFWAPLLAGATMVVARQDKTYDLGHLIGLIAEHRVSVAQFVPSLLETLVDYPEFASLASLERVFVGGEALTQRLKNKMARRMGGARLCNLYGPTEVCIDATFEEVTRDTGSEAADRSITIGRPIDNLRVVLVDTRGRLAGVGIAGEICIAGAGVFLGYFGRPDLTAERTFVPAFSDALHYRTGDLGRMRADGRIEYLGRIDRQVKLNGYRIELAEIDVVIESMANVRRAVTVVAGTQLVSFVQTRERTAVDPQALCEHARRLLPDYMVPTRIEALDDYPLLPNGKLDREGLRWMAERQPQVSRFEPPATETERVLAEIWSKVLGLSEVSVDDKFFALGGDSIRSIQVVYEASRRALAFTVMDIFQFQTVRALAAHVQAGANTAAAQATPLADPTPATLRQTYADAYPATAMQRYMIQRYRDDHHAIGVFHAQQAFSFTSNGLDAEALASALTRAGDSPNFRTRFVAQDGEWFQVLSGIGGPQVQRIDLTGLPEAEQRAAIDCDIAADRAARFDPFDLRSELLRVRLYQRGSDWVEILLSNHHAVQDGWGNVVFMNRVAEHYRAIAQGEAYVPEYEHGGGVCKEFALLQHCLIADPDQASFWRCQLDAFPPSSPVFDTACGERYTTEAIDLPPALVSALQSFSRERNLSTKAVVLAAFARALQSRSLQAVIGVVSNGRNEQLSDPFHAMGLFWNLMPFVAPDTVQSADGGCAAVQACLLEMEPYSRFPLPDIEALSGRARLIDVSFNFVNFHNQRSSGGSGRLGVTHVLDNFGLPLSLTVAVDGKDSMSLLLQTDAALGAAAEAPLNGFATAFVEALADIVGRRHAARFSEGGSSR